MKNLLLYFSLFIFHFSFGQKQDTIVLMNGGKMAAKVISFNNRVIYSLPSDTNQKSIKSSKVSYIKYTDGSIYTITTNTKDSLTHTWKPYILISGGFSKPWTFSGYGANSFYSNYDGYGYSGYAYNGTDYSITAGIKNPRGWEFTGLVSYIPNQFDVNGVMKETVSNFMLGNGIININHLQSIGTYYYHNFSLLGGITKSWGGDKTISAGFSLIFGDFITYTPSMHGIVSGTDFQTGQTTLSYYFNIDSKTQNNFVAELGFHIDAPITSHIFIRILLEIEMSGLTNGGGYQFVDMTTGSTIYSGSYYGGSVGFNSSSFFVGLSDITFGLGYKF